MPNLVVKYKYFTNGVESVSGTFDLDIAPQSKQIYELKDINNDSNQFRNIVFEYFVDDFLVASEQVVLSKGQLNESICKNGKIGLNKSRKQAVHYI